MSIYIGNIRVTNPSNNRSVTTPSNNRSANCRFDLKCFDPSCRSVHSNVFCMNSGNCQDFYCKYRHLKIRKRPCAAGGACRQTTCEYLHPIAAKKTMCLVKPNEDYIKYLVRMHKCSYEYIKQSSTLILESDRGIKFVDEVVQKLSTQKAITIKERDLKNYDTIKIFDHSIVNESDELDGLLVNHFKKLGFENLNIILQQKHILFVTTGDTSLNSDLIKCELDNELKLAELPHNKCDNSWLELVEKNAKYAIASEKKICRVFTFEDIHSMDSMKYIHNVKVVLDTNKILCGKEVCQYLANHSKIFNLLREKQWCDIAKNGEYVTLNNFGEFGENSAEQKINYIIDKICNLDFTMTNGDIDKMCEFLIIKFPKTVVTKVGKWNIQITTYQKNVPVISRFIENLHNTDMKTIVIRDTYANFLLSHGNRIIGDKYPFVVSSHKVMIITKKEESIIDLQNKITNGSAGSFALESLDAKEYEYTIDEYQEKYEKIAEWIKNKHHVVLQEKKEQKKITISFLGIARLNIKAQDEYEDYDEYIMCMKFREWVSLRKQIKINAKDASVTTNVSIKNYDEIELLIQGNSLSVAQFMSHY